MRTGYEVRTTLRSWFVLILLALAVMSCLAGLVTAGVQFGTPILPVTSIIAPAVAQSVDLILLITVVLLGGQLVWHERQTGTAEIIGATPTSSLVFFASKLAAMGLVIAAILGVSMATGIAFQVAKGGTHIDMAAYILVLFVLTGSSALMVGVFSIFVQTIVNNRYVGLLLTVGLLVCVEAGEFFAPKYALLWFARHPAVPLSEMNGSGHFLYDTLWFKAYWGCITMLLGIATYLLWVRGIAAPLVVRFRILRHSVAPTILSLTVLALLGASATGGHIFWNTRTIDAYQTSADFEQWRVDYEKAYRPFETLPQPRITGVEVAVDLKPESLEYSSRGQYILTNRSGVPIDQVYVWFMPQVTVEKIELAGADIVDKNTHINYFVFRLHAPLTPGEERPLTFATSVQRPRFHVEIGRIPTFAVNNGTFVRNPDFTPFVGISRGLYLEDEKRRRALGLEPLDSASKPNDKSRHDRNQFRADSDLVRFAVTISTSPDQTAVAPGYLEREWAENGRRHFRYEMDKPMLNIWAVSSARYAIARDRWNDVDIAVYHHPSHDINVPRMIEASKQSLAYFSEKFGPYQHRQFRIVEFPGYADFAQSFPNTVPYSETFGFLVDNRNPAHIDYVWHVTAHEVAHQWWGHQVSGANALGAQFLSETLAEYSALMVTELRYGPDMVRRFLRYNLDQYLQGRAQDRLGERPLAHVEHHQDYIAYRKGAVAMYALKDAIGETAVNRALARFVSNYGSNSGTFPTSSDLMRLLRAEAGRQHQQLITDLFEKIVLWELAVTQSSATQTADGKWRVRLDVSAKKLEADSQGVEKEVPLDQAIDVGLFTDDPNNAGFTAKDVIALEKRRITTGTQTIEFVVDRKPAYVGVNPYLTLIERNARDNIAAVGG